MNGSAPKPPTWWFYVLGFLLMTGGGVLFARSLWKGISHVTDGLVQVVVPGQAQLNFEHGQTYTVFLETQSVVDGKIYSTSEPVNGLSCKVQPVAGGEGIHLFRAGGTSYNVRGRSGRSVLQFHVPEDGMYEFGCSYGEGRHGPQTVVAVGSGVGSAITRTLAMGLLAFFGGLGAGLLTCILTFVLRQRAQAHSSGASSAAS